MFHLKSNKEKSKQLEDFIQHYHEKIQFLERDNYDLRNQLTDVRISPGWKLLLSFRKYLNRYFPIGTKHRRVLDSTISKTILKSKIEEKQKEISNLERKKNKNYVKWKFTTQKIYNGKRKKIKKRNEVSIIITVHNGSKVAIPCIESVFKWSTEPFNVIIVDDGSTEEKLLNYLDNVSKKRNVDIIHNENNIGYLKSINKAIKTTKNDIILLNSDTIVTKKWNDKLYACAYSHEKIAVCCPLSNNATICSIPEFTQPNSIPLGYSLDTFAELVEEISNKKYAPSPTCPAFCLFMKRKMIEEIGLFDEKFSPAYSEEDDYCMRAYKKGYLSVIDDDNFVFHMGEQSYTEKSESLKEKHMQILLQKHPEYLEIVSGFCANDPLMEFRENLNFILNKKKKKSFECNLLVILHRPIYTKNPGGTELFCKSLYEKMGTVNRYVMYPDNGNITIQEIQKSGKVRTIFKINREKRAEGNFEYTIEEKEFFLDIINELKIDIVHFHHILDLPMDLVHLFKNRGVKTIFSIHDFYFICPTIFLFENGDVDKFCFACQDMKRCNLCLSSLGISHIKQEDWRAQCQNVLERVDLIISPTISVQEIFSKTYDLDISKMKVIPHGFDYNLINYDKKPSKKLRVGFIGAVKAKRKGRDIIIKLIHENYIPDIEWHFFGGDSDISEFINKDVLSQTSFHGRYENEEDLPKILREYEIDLVILPSMETFSIVLSEVWNANIPVIVPNIMALGERVKKFGGGWIYDYPGSSKMILDILNEVYNNRSLVDEKIFEIKNMAKTSREQCVNEYLEIYNEIIYQKMLL